MPRRSAARARARPAPPRTKGRAGESSLSLAGRSQQRIAQPSLSGSGKPAPAAPVRLATFLLALSRIRRRGMRCVRSHLPLFFKAILEYFRIFLTHLPLPLTGGGWVGVYRPIDRAVHPSPTPARQQAAKPAYPLPSRGEGKASHFKRPTSPPPSAPFPSRASLAPCRSGERHRRCGR